MKIKMLQHIFLAVRIPERHILKHHVSLDPFPVLLLWRKSVTIFFRRFLAVLHIRLLFQQIHDPLNISLTGNHFRKQLSKLLNRLKNNHSIGNKHRQGSQLHDLFLHHPAATNQHNRRCNRAEKKNHRNIDRIQPGRTAGCPVHLRCCLKKRLVIVRFNPHAF